jgi:hypothetical protein
MIAYCDTSGIVLFGRSLPHGSLPIAIGPARKLKRIVLGIASTRKDGLDTPYLRNVRMDDLLGYDALEELGIYRKAVEHKLAGKPGWPAVRRKGKPTEKKLLRQAPARVKQRKLLSTAERRTLALMLGALQGGRGYHTGDAPRLAEFDAELAAAKTLCTKLRKA